MKETAQRFWLNWGTHELTQRAAALAYSALFALAPILLVLMVVAVSLLGQQSADGELYSRISDVAGVPAANEVLRLAHGASRTSDVRSAIIGVVVALIAGLGMILQFEAAIDAIWEEPSRAKDGIWVQVRQRLIAAIALVVIATAFLGLAMVDAAVARFGNGEALFAHVFAWSGAAVCIFALFAVVYRTVPQKRPQWREAMTAGLVTTVLVLVGQVGFAIYLHFVNVGSAYGDAGSVIVLLVWLYYSSLAALAGAELARVIQKAR